MKMNAIVSACLLGVLGLAMWAALFYGLYRLFFC